MSDARVKTDIEELERLNTDYVNSVQRSDVARFEQILAPDFYCSNPDGSLVDRAAFLRQTARPVTITELRPEQVKILREAFQRTLKDAAFLEEVKSKKLDAEYTSGEEMETLAKEMMSQRPEVIERLKKVLGN